MAAISDLIILVTIRVIYCCVYFSDGYAYYEEWQSLKEKSDKQVKALLESFGSKCKDQGVIIMFGQMF